MHRTGCGIHREPDKTTEYYVSKCHAMERTGECRGTVEVASLLADHAYIVFALLKNDAGRGRICYSDRDTLTGQGTVAPVGSVITVTV